MRVQLGLLLCRRIIEGTPAMWGSLGRQAEIRSAGLGLIGIILVVVSIAMGIVVVGIAVVVAVRNLLKRNLGNRFVRAIVACRRRLAGFEISNY